MSSPTEIPCTDQAYHVVMMVFTLHHMESSKEQETLLTEALRVARRRLVILEDTAVGPVEWLTNRAFDYCLNVRNGVPCPFTFRSTEAWITTLERLGFCVRHSQKFPRHLAHPQDLHAKHHRRRTRATLSVTRVTLTSIGRTTNPRASRGRISRKSCPLCGDSPASMA